MVKFDMDGAQNVEVSVKIPCEKSLKEQLEIMEEYTRVHKEGAKLSKESRELGDKVSIMMEGHIYTPEDAMKCMFLGADAVVVGSAITRPHLTTKRFTDLLSGYQNNWRDAERSKH